MPLFLLFIFWGTLSFAQTYPCPATYAELDVVKLEVKNKDEFYFCFGYHHGKDRAWAMDYFRRSAEGRNSEVFGFDHLKSDLMMRLLNLEGHAARIWNLYPAEEKKNLEAYSRGVNAGFKLGKTAKEFVDGEYEPEAWKPVHTLEVLLFSLSIRPEKHLCPIGNRKDLSPDGEIRQHSSWIMTVLLGKIRS